MSGHYLPLSWLPLDLYDFMCCLDVLMVRLLLLTAASQTKQHFRAGASVFFVNYFSLYMFFSFSTSEVVEVIVVVVVFSFPYSFDIPPSGIFVAYFVFFFITLFFPFLSLS